MLIALLQQLVSFGHYCCVSITTPSGDVKDPFRRMYGFPNGPCVSGQSRVYACEQFSADAVVAVSASLGDV